ncbi:uncharacterized protein LOC141904228 [Tubulanus polymorphus]|uniref:uncharacterized protein LOC141904228 n=1 Tax=Tubulanus polymorphus TaxID=672921 RepID=UPI003DA4182D
MDETPENIKDKKNVRVTRRKRKFNPSRTVTASSGLPHNSPTTVTPTAIPVPFSALPCSRGDGGEDVFHELLFGSSQNEPQEVEPPNTSHPRNHQQQPRLLKSPSFQPPSNGLGFSEFKSPSSCLHLLEANSTTAKVHFPKFPTAFHNVLCTSFELPTDEFGAFQIEKLNSIQSGPDQLETDTKSEQQRNEECVRAKDRIAVSDSDSTESENGVNKKGIRPSDQLTTNISTIRKRNEMSESYEASKSVQQKAVNFSAIDSNDRSTSMDDHKIITFKKCVQLSAMNMKFRPTVGRVGRVITKAGDNVNVIILCSNSQTVVLIEDDEENDKHWRKLRSFNHKQCVEILSCCIISHRFLLAFVLCSVDKMQSSAKIYTCNLQAARTGRGGGRNSSRILCHGDLSKSQSKYSNPMLCYPDCDREVIVGRRLKWKTILTKFILGHNYTTVLANLDFDSIDDDVYSLVCVDGIRSLVLACSNRSITFWSCDSGAIVKMIDLNETINSLKSCLLAKHEQGLLYLIVEDETRGVVLLAVNPHTKSSVILQRYNNTSYGLLSQVSVISDYIVFQSDKSIELRDVYNATTVARLDSTQPPPSCLLLTGETDSISTLVTVNDDLCLHVYNLKKTKSLCC